MKVSDSLADITKRKTETAIFVLFLGTVFILAFFAYQATPKQFTPQAALSPLASTQQNLLDNQSFEKPYNCNGSWCSANGWEPFGAETNSPPCVAGQPGCYWQCPQNCIDAHGQGCLVDYSCWIASPELKEATVQFPERVLDGNSAQQLFVWGRLGEGGVRQNVQGIVPGAEVNFVVWGQSWQDYNNPPLDGKTHSSGRIELMAGISPIGAITYTDSSIVWQTIESVDAWSRLQVTATAQADNVTVFVMCRVFFPWAHIHNNCYFDNAALFQTLPTTPTSTPTTTPTKVYPTPTKTATPGPTNTPYPTWTPRPTYTPYPPGYTTSTYLPVIVRNHPTVTLPMTRPYAYLTGALTLGKLSTVTLALRPLTDTQAIEVFVFANAAMIQPYTVTLLAEGDVQSDVDARAGRVARVLWQSSGVYDTDGPFASIAVTPTMTGTALFDWTVFFGNKAGGGAVVKGKREIEVIE